MVLLKGSASIRLVRRKRKVCIDQLQPGNFFLEPILPRPDDFSFDLYTNTACVFGEIPLVWDEIIASKDQRLTALILNEISRSMVNVRGYLFSMKYDDAESRIVNLLNYVAKSQSEPGNGEWLPVSITYQEIGVASHCSLRQVHRVMADLRGLDLIRSPKRGSIEIHNSLMNSNA